MITLFVAVIEVMNPADDDGFGTSSQAMFTTSDTAYDWKERQMDKLTIRSNWKGVEDRYEWTDPHTGFIYQSYIYEDNVYETIEEEEEAVKARLAEFEKRFGKFC